MQPTGYMTKLIGAVPGGGVGPHCHSTRIGSEDADTSSNAYPSVYPETSESWDLSSIWSGAYWSIQRQTRAGV